MGRLQVGEPDGDGSREVDARTRCRERLQSTRPPPPPHRLMYVLQHHVQDLPFSLFYWLTRRRDVYESRMLRLCLFLSIIISQFLNFVSRIYTTYIHKLQ